MRSNSNDIASGIGSGGVLGQANIKLKEIKDSDEATVIFTEIQNTFIEVEKSNSYVLVSDKLAELSAKIASLILYEQKLLAEALTNKNKEIADGKTAEAEGYRNNLVNLIQQQQKKSYYQLLKSLVSASCENTQVKSLQGLGKCSQDAFGYYVSSKFLGSSVPPCEENVKASISNLLDVLTANEVTSAYASLLKTSLDEEKKTVENNFNRFKNYMNNHHEKLLRTIGQGMGVFAIHCAIYLTVVAIVIATGGSLTVPAIIAAAFVSGVVGNGVSAKLFKPYKPAVKSKAIASQMEDLSNVLAPKKKRSC